MPLPLHDCKHAWSNTMYNTSCLLCSRAHRIFCCGRPHAAAFVNRVPSTWRPTNAVMCCVCACIPAAYPAACACGNCAQRHSCHSFWLGCSAYGNPPRVGHRRLQLFTADTAKSNQRPNLPSALWHTCSCRGRCAPRSHVVCRIRLHLVHTPDRGKRCKRAATCPSRSSPICCALTASSQTCSAWCC